MRNAKVLIITMRALANEVAKNLVLAGIGSLTVMDPDVVEDDDLGAQFFISEEHVGRNVSRASVGGGILHKHADTRCRGRRLQLQPFNVSIRVYQ